MRFRRHRRRRRIRFSNRRFRRHRMGGRRRFSRRHRRGRAGRIRIGYRL